MLLFHSSKKGIALICATLFTSTMILLSVKIIGNMFLAQRSLVNYSDHYKTMMHALTFWDEILIEVQGKRGWFDQQTDIQEIMYLASEELSLHATVSPFTLEEEGVSLLVEIFILNEAPNQKRILIKGLLSIDSQKTFRARHFTLGGFF